MPQAACFRAFPIQYTEEALNEGFSSEFCIIGIIVKLPNS